MKKYFCDRCNGETTLNTPCCVTLNTQEGIEFSLDMAGYDKKFRRRLDLCHKCVGYLLQDCLTQIADSGGEKLLEELRKW